MIKHIKKSDIPRRNGNVENKAAVKDLADFMACSAAAGEIVIPEGKTAKAFRDIYARAAARRKYPVKFAIRAGKVYILKIYGKDDAK